ncbi:flagellar hook-length control protein FliK [Methylomonas montana]|uniref:flagellar hook-length control protein FliK n=1 Tax=Methylomonas montana TaxID=3058963 RepID=UPI0026598E82|nr:flagellar hook-length control protein FliK [Methylomonas montana]WKJ89079.1 flagellar hook-length control protein FliK [Methylomonas montana]
MDIKLPLDAKLQLAIDKVGGTAPELKLNQILDAKIITHQATLNTLSVSIAGKTLTLQNQQALPLQPGQTLQLQVAKLLPTLELKILEPPSTSGSLTAQGAEPAILKLLSPPTSSSTTSPSSLINTLSSGQQLQVQIVDIGKHTLTVQLISLPSGNFAENTTGSSTNPQPLVLDNKQLLWTQTGDKAALTVGSRIDLQVSNTGANPIFKASLSAVAIEEHIVAAYKQLLPQQSPPALLLHQLNQAISTLIDAQNVGETLKQLALKILLAIPDKARLFEPASLKQLIAQSGLFMERGLLDTAQSNPPTLALQQDFKLTLSKFIAQLGLEMATSAQSGGNELLKEILQKAQGSLARITLDQLNSLPRDDSPKQVWLLELPFFNNATPETVQLLIEQDKQADQQGGQKNWVVSITITPPELDTIHCKISCYDGSVNTRFWSESTSTVDKINARLDYLRQQFEEKGLKPGFMDAQQGKPAQPNLQTMPTNLLSEKV